MRRSRRRTSSRASGFHTRRSIRDAEEKDRSGQEEDINANSAYVAHGIEVRRLIAAVFAKEIISGDK
jgi:hypothetical protein